MFGRMQRQSSPRFGRVVTTLTLAISIAFGVTGPGSAQTWPVLDGILGHWRSAGPVIDTGLQKMYLVMVITTGSVTFRYDCRYLDGTILKGSLTARAEVSPTAIRILEPSRSHVGNADSECAVTIVPSTLPYLLSGDSLTVTFKDKPVPMLRTGG